MQANPRQKAKDLKEAPLTAMLHPSQIESRTFTRTVRKEDTQALAMR